MQKTLKTKLLMLGILLLSFGYGYYTTFARISGGNAESTSRVALAELASSALALLWGILADRYGSRKVALVGLMATFIANAGTKPLEVFLTLSSFYAPFLISLLQASAYGSETLGEAVASLSLGWGLGVIALEYCRGYYDILSLSFVLGTIFVILSSERLEREFKPFEAILKLRPIVVPLSIFVGAEYLAYALTALRFYQISPSMFVFSYAVFPSITSFICGYYAGRAVRIYGAGKVLILSMAIYPMIVVLALIAPPPWCLISWSIPVYPFYETSLISLVINLAKVSEGSALGFIYALMAFSSLVVYPLTMLNRLYLMSGIIVVLMVISVVLIRIALKKVISFSS